MKRFSDFAQEPTPLDGEKARLDDVLNCEMVVTGCSIKQSKYSKNRSGKYLTLQFKIDDVTRVCFTGSDVLIGQMERYENEMPFVATIRKINRYYTLA
jgi:hypothetical protein